MDKLEYGNISNYISPILVLVQVVMIMVVIKDLPLITEW